MAKSTNVLILGNDSEAHASHLDQALTQAGATVDYFNTYRFPTQLKISWEINRQIGYLSLSSERQLKFQDIKSVFWRNYSGVGIPKLQDFNQNKIAVNDSISLLRSLMQVCPARWVNSWQAYQFHKEKPLQLLRVKNLGINIPATLITNDPKQATEFTQSYERVISKPVYGGAYTRGVTKSNLEVKRMSLALRLAPVTLQEYIPGTNIRTYVIANSVYAAEIRSNSLDFREDSEAKLIVVDVPESLRQKCLAIAKALHLEWTAIDWRKTPAGEYIFLEANPSPMFIYFEAQTGFPITQELVKLLLS